MARRGAGRRWLAAGLLVLLLLAGLAWWFFGAAIQGFWASDPPVETEVSEAAALQAEAKLMRLRETGETVRLSDTEFTSLLRYRLRDRIMGDLREPAVAFSGDTLRLRGTIPTDRLPSVPELDRVRPFLPDTAEVLVLGQLAPLEGGRAAIQVQRVTFGGIPIPERMYPGALERLGRRDEPGLAETSYPFSLPEGVGTARLQDGMLVLTPPS